MAVIELGAFIGEMPRVIPRLLPPNASASAIDTRMDDGSLEPFSAPGLVHTFPGAPNYQTIYRHNGTWLGWTGIVNAVPGPVDADRLYYTGDGVPKMLAGGTVYPLAVPRPTAKPSAAITAGVGTGPEISRIYVVTHVTGFGEESEPSPASDPLNWQAGETVTLSNIDAPPGGRNITLQRFYRSQTGTLGTDLYFIAERAASAANFVDTVPVDIFSEVLPSRTWNPPPDGLTGLIALPNGMMAGFVGKRLYFCEPFRPHAWPEVYSQIVDTPIVALGAMATELIVLTTGQPWRVMGSTPASMSMEKLETMHPCINARGLVDFGYAVVWPSNDGLAIAQVGGGVSLLTGALFNPLDWRRFNPQIIPAGHLHGRWIGSYSTLDDLGNAIEGSLIITVASEASSLIRSSVVAKSWYYEVSTENLYFLAPDGSTVWQFDPPGGSPLGFFYRSKDFFLPREENFGVILIDTGAGFSAEEIIASDEEIAAILDANAAMIAAGTAFGYLNSLPINTVPVNGDLLLYLPAGAMPDATSATITVFANDILVASVGITDRPTRLPAGFRARKWAIAAAGNKVIEKISMARTVDELKTVAPQ